MPQVTVEDVTPGWAYGLQGASQTLAGMEKTRLLRKQDARADETLKLQQGAAGLAEKKFGLAEQALNIQLRQQNLSEKMAEWEQGLKAEDLKLRQGQLDLSRRQSARVDEDYARKASEYAFEQELRGDMEGANKTRLGVLRAQAFRKFISENEGDGDVDDLKDVWFRLEADVEKLSPAEGLAFYRDALKPPDPKTGQMAGVLWMAADTRYKRKATRDVMALEKERAVAEGTAEQIQALLDGGATGHDINGALTAAKLNHAAMVGRMQQWAQLEEPLGKMAALFGSVAPGTGAAFPAVMEALRQSFITGDKDASPSAAINKLIEVLQKDQEEQTKLSVARMRETGDIIQGLGSEEGTERLDLFNKSAGASGQPSARPGGDPSTGAPASPNLSLDGPGMISQWGMRKGDVPELDYGRGWNSIIENIFGTNWDGLGLSQQNWMHKAIRASEAGEKLPPVPKGLFEDPSPKKAPQLPGQPKVGDPNAPQLPAVSQHTSSLMPQEEYDKHKDAIGKVYQEMFSVPERDLPRILRKNEEWLRESLKGVDLADEAAIRERLRFSGMRDPAYFRKLKNKPNPRTGKIDG